MLTKDVENLILSPTRYMLWKIQSGIAPPFFYVIVAEQDKLKTLKSFLRRETQNAVEPLAQLPMYAVNKWPLKSSGKEQKGPGCKTPKVPNVWQKL